jgi:hypothetical protein
MLSGTGPNPAANGASPREMECHEEIADQVAALFV